MHGLAGNSDSHNNVNPYLNIDCDITTLGKCRDGKFVYGGGEVERPGRGRDEGVKRTKSPSSRVGS